MSRSPAAPVLGLALVAALVAFVVAMEYDPDAAAFLEDAEIDVGTIVAVDDTGSATVAVNDTSIPDIEVPPPSSDSTA